MSLLRCVKQFPPSFAFVSSHNDNHSCTVLYSSSQASAPLQPLVPIAEAPLVVAYPTIQHATTVYVLYARSPTKSHITMKLVYDLAAACKSCNATNLTLQRFPDVDVVGCESIDVAQELLGLLAQLFSSAHEDVRVTLNKPPKGTSVFADQCEQSAPTTLHNATQTELLAYYDNYEDLIPDRTPGSTVTLLHRWQSQTASRHGTINLNIEGGRPMDSGPNTWSDMRFSDVGMVDKPRDLLAASAIQHRGKPAFGQRAARSERTTTGNRQLSPGRPTVISPQERGVLTPHRPPLASSGNERQEKSGADGVDVDNPDGREAVGGEAAGKPGLNVHNDGGVVGSNNELVGHIGHGGSDDTGAPQNSVSHAPDPAVELRLEPHSVEDGRGGGAANDGASDSSMLAGAPQAEESNDSQPQGHQHQPLKDETALEVLLSGNDVGSATAQVGAGNNIRSPQASMEEGSQPPTSTLGNDASDGGLHAPRDINPATIENDKKQGGVDNLGVPTPSSKSNVTGSVKIAVQRPASSSTEHTRGKELGRFAASNRPATSSYRAGGREGERQLCRGITSTEPHPFSLSESAQVVVEHPQPAVHVSSVHAICCDKHGSVVATEYHGTNATQLHMWPAQHGPKIPLRPSIFGPKGELSAAPSGGGRGSAAQRNTYQAERGASLGPW